MAQAFLLLALLMASLGSTTEAQPAAESSAPERHTPQLGPNTNAGPEVPMTREARPSATPAASNGATTLRVTLPRNPLWMILAVLAVLAARFGLKRWITRSRDQK